MQPNESSKAPILTPTQRRLVAQMQLSAKKSLVSISTGRHRSQARGTSAEFKEHRQYVPGDPPRAVDWKLFGKTDRLFIRQYENETSLPAMILLDQSGSMGFSGSRSGGQSKHGFAVQLAACVATLATQQQDPVGLVTFDSKIRQFIPTRNRPSHLAQIFSSLARSSPASETRVAPAISEIALRIRSRGSIVILISDLLDTPQDILSALRRLDVGGHEVIVFQVLDPDEREFPFRQKIEFTSLEDASDRRRLSSRQFKQRYLKNASEFQDVIAQGLAQSRIDFVPCTTDQDVGGLLLHYFSARDGAPSRRSMR